MNEVLVTGATGFIGRHVCRLLVDDGHSVTAACRESSDRSALADVGVEWAVADVLDADAVRTAVDGHDRVVHLAGLGLLDADEGTVHRVNVEGTRNVLDASREHGVERVLFASTAGTRRRVDGPATESDVAEPVGVYQRSKARAERLVDDFVDAGGDAVTVHPTSVFGPGDETFTARLLSLATDPKMVAYLPGGASIVDVRDVARGIATALADGKPGEHYILGGENLQYREAVEVLAHLADGTTPRLRVPGTAIRAAGPAVGAVNGALGTQVFPVNADMARLATSELFYSSEKARAELGYDARPLRAHAADAIEWYLSRRATA